MSFTPSSLTRGLWLAICLVLMQPALLRAQEEDIETQFRKVSPEEEARLKAILAEPLATDALKTQLQQQINQKRMAAKRLSMPELEESLLREAIPLVQDIGLQNDLAIAYRNRGDYEQAVAQHRSLLPQTNLAQKPFFMTHVANDLLQWGKTEQARQELEKAGQAIEAAQQARLGQGGQRTLLRGTYFHYFVLSLLEQRQGRWNASIQAAAQAEQAARKALAMKLPQDDGLMRLNIASDVANALARRTQAYRGAGNFADAEQVLREYIRFAAEEALPLKFRSGIYITAANLRFGQREFAQAEQLARKSEQILEELGEAPLSPNRATRRRDLFMAQAGQAKWAQALQEVRRLDNLAKGDSAATNRVRFGFDRAYVYLGNGLHTEAAQLFERVAQANLQTYGDGHFYVAQARGLQGVALWRSGDPTQKSRALPLLEQAAHDLVAPRNADYLDQYGIRPETRQLIIGTCIEALAEVDATRASHALGLADWLRAGAVQEALADASLRAAAHTQGLADLVRQEQDAKNEIRGLQSFLQGEVGGARAAAPEVAAQMRERITALEKQRSDLQTRIKADFPGYDRLVRPLPPRLDEIAVHLRADEALWVFMPDATGVNVWAVKQDQGKAVARFHRAPMDRARLQQLVMTLRGSLESLGTQGKLLPFNHALAHEAYKTLLGPLAADMADRPQWIVAASGALARLPLAVLQTQAPQAGVAPAWLIRQVGLSQVPSVGAWLSLRALPRHQLPQQMLMAWGDPVFNPGQSASHTGAVRNLSAAAGAGTQDLERELPNGTSLYHAIPALPETRDELQGLARTLQADPQRDLVMGRQATRESVLKASQSGELAQRKVVVFATHGLMAGELPRLTQPALAMAADGSEKSNALAPLLTLEDVLGLKLNADWVVLSACNTAAADGRAEEALSGLARGFFYAGTRSLLVTHWAVESESAKELTTRTFGHFTSQPQAPKADSLRQAMLQVMAQPQYAHPAFWAPYVLVGDAQR
ncbi:MAG: CHAT domain-containing protein [Limnohabitans sp.]